MTLVILNQEKQTKKEVCSQCQDGSQGLIKAQPNAISKQMILRLKKVVWSEQGG
jgi:translation initiation factor 2B subunit (eIF-2B alpha/beta/delta family)